MTGAPKAQEGQGLGAQETLKNRNVGRVSIGSLPGRLCNLLASHPSPHPAKRLWKLQLFKKRQVIIVH